MPETEGQGQRVSDLDLRPREATQDTCLGKIRRCGDLGGMEIGLLVISMVGLIACLALTIAKIIHYQGDDFTFALLIIVNTLFCFYYILDGIYRERPYELAIFLVATIIVIVYVIVNFLMTNGWEDTIKIIRLAFAAVLAPLVVIMGICILKEYCESGNLIFRTVGASSELQSCCKHRLFTGSVLKLDFQIGVSLVVLVLNDGRVLGLEVIPLAVGIPVTCIWLLLALLCMQYESRILTLIVWCTSWLEPAYVIYKIWDEATHPSNSKALPTVIFVCAAFAFLIRFIVILSLVFVYRNYGKGLKEKMVPIFQRKKAPPQRKSTAASSTSSNQV